MGRLTGAIKVGHLVLSLRGHNKKTHGLYLTQNESQVSVVLIDHSWGTLHPLPKILASGIWSEALAYELIPDISPTHFTLAVINTIAVISPESIVRSMTYEHTIDNDWAGHVLILSIIAKKSRVPYHRMYQEVPVHLNLEPIKRPNMVEYMEKVTDWVTTYRQAINSRLITLTDRPSFQVLDININIPPSSLFMNYLSNQLPITYYGLYEVSTYLAGKPTKDAFEIRANKIEYTPSDQIYYQPVTSSTHTGPRATVILPKSNGKGLVSIEPGVSPMLSDNVWLFCIGPSICNEPIDSNFIDTLRYLEDGTGGFYTSPSHDLTMDLISNALVYTVLSHLITRRIGKTLRYRSMRRGIIKWFKSMLTDTQTGFYYSKVWRQGEWVIKGIDPTSQAQVISSLGPHVLDNEVFNRAQATMNLALELVQETGLGPTVRPVVCTTEIFQILISLQVVKSGYQTDRLDLTIRSIENYLYSSPNGQVLQVENNEAYFIGSGQATAYHILYAQGVNPF